MWLPSAARKEPAVSSIRVASMVGNNRVADAEDTHDTVLADLDFEDEIRRLQADPTPQIPLLGVAAIVEETNDWRVILGGPSAGRVFGCDAQRHAVWIGARHGAQGHGVGQCFAAVEVYLQGIQSQCRCRLFRRSGPLSSNTRVRGVSVTYASRCSSAGIAVWERVRPAASRAPQAVGGGDQLLYVLREG